MPIPRTEDFTGDGSTLNFALLGPVYGRTEVVHVNGIPQPHTTSYTLSSNLKTVQFILAPLTGDFITVYYLEADS